MLFAAVDPDSFLAVVAVGALAGTLATMAAARGILVPTVVAELVLGDPAPVEPAPKAAVAA